MLAFCFAARWPSILEGLWEKIKDKGKREKGLKLSGFVEPAHLFPLSFFFYPFYPLVHRLRYNTAMVLFGTHQ
jgi:hypothetical protein